MKYIVSALIFMTAVGQIAAAEQKISKGDYDLHYNTFPSTFLDSKVANTHQIKRSNTRGIISITLMDNRQEPATATEGKLHIKITNLLGQSQQLDIKTIKENDGGVYYLATFKMNHEENLNFEVTAKPTGTKTMLTHQFSRVFYTD